MVCALDERVCGHNASASTYACSPAALSFRCRWNESMRSAYRLRIIWWKQNADNKHAEKVYFIYCSGGGSCVRLRRRASMHRLTCCRSLRTAHMAFRKRLVLLLSPKHDMSRMRSMRTRLRQTYRHASTRTHTSARTHCAFLSGRHFGGQRYCGTSTSQISLRWTAMWTVHITRDSNQNSQF